MSTYIIENAFILARNKTIGEDGSLVIIQPDDEINPLMCIIKYQNDNVTFISNDWQNRIYSVDDATILGDVISIKYIFKNN